CWRGRARSTPTSTGAESRLALSPRRRCSGRSGTPPRQRSPERRLRRRSVDRRRSGAPARRIVDVDGDAGAVFRSRADAHAAPATGIAAPAEAPTADADADAAAAVAFGGALEQHAIGAKLGGRGTQLADDGVHLVLLPVGEATAGCFQHRDLVIAARGRGVIDLHLLGRDRRTRGTEHHFRRAGAATRQQRHAQHHCRLHLHQCLLGPPGPDAASIAPPATLQGEPPARSGQPIPPLMPMTWPLMYPAASEHRNATSAATSSGRPARPAGTSCFTASAGKASAAMRPSITPGATTLTVMPRLAISRASDLEAPWSPALAAA